MSTSNNSHYFSTDPNQIDELQQQEQVHFALLTEPHSTNTSDFEEYNHCSMMEQRTTTINPTPDFGPLQVNNLFYGRSSPSTTSSPLHHIIIPHPQEQQHDQKDERTRFVLRLAILLQRLHKMGDHHHQLSIRRVKQIVRYATQRNRMGDARFCPLVDTIERCLADLVGCDEWFSICLEAEQRHRVRKISQTMMMVSSTMTTMLGSSMISNNNNINVLPSSSSASSSSGTGGSPFHKPTPSNFSASFFP